MPEYGIPDIRDADGDLKGVDHTYEWNGHEVTIKHVPVTISEQQDIEAQGADVDVEYMQDFLDDHLVKPAAPAGDWSLAEVLCYFEGMIDFASGGGNDLMQQAREELERRAAAEQGN